MLYKRLMSFIPFLHTAAWSGSQRNTSSALWVKNLLLIRSGVQIWGPWAPVMSSSLSHEQSAVNVSCFFFFTNFSSYFNFFPQEKHHMKSNFNLHSFPNLKFDTCPSLAGQIFSVHTEMFAMRTQPGAWDTHCVTMFKCWLASRPFDTRSWTPSLTTENRPVYLCKQ